MIWRLLRPQGVAGLALAAVLLALLVAQKAETRHWRRQSGQFAELYARERSAFASTVASARAAAAEARARDQANLQRVASDQRAISERISDDYQGRLAAAHALARRLRVQAAAGAADPGVGREPSLPGVSAAPGRTSGAAGQARLPVGDAELATAQAIQLDALIAWVKAQAAVSTGRQ